MLITMGNGLSRTTTSGTMEAEADAEATTFFDEKGEGEQSDIKEESSAEEMHSILPPIITKTQMKIRKKSVTFRGLPGRNRPKSSSITPIPVEKKSSMMSMSFEVPQPEITLSMSSSGRSLNVDKPRPRQRSRIPVIIAPMKLDYLLDLQNNNGEGDVCSFPEPDQSPWSEKGQGTNKKSEQCQEVPSTMEEYHLPQQYITMTATVMPTTTTTCPKPTTPAAPAPTPIESVLSTTTTTSSSTSSSTTSSAPEKKKLVVRGLKKFVESRARSHPPQWVRDFPVKSKYNADKYLYDWENVEKNKPSFPPQVPFKKSGRCESCGIYSVDTCRCCKKCPHDCRCPQPPTNFPDVSNQAFGDGWSSAQKVICELTREERQHPVGGYHNAKGSGEDGLQNMRRARECNIDVLNPSRVPSPKRQIIQSQPQSQPRPQRNSAPPYQQHQQPHPPQCYPNYPMMPMQMPPMMYPSYPQMPMQMPMQYPPMPMSMPMMGMGMGMGPPQMPYQNPYGPEPPYY